MKNEREQIPFGDGSAGQPNPIWASPAGQEYLTNRNAHQRAARMRLYSSNRPRWRAAAGILLGVGVFAYIAAECSANAYTTPQVPTGANGQVTPRNSYEIDLGQSIRQLIDPSHAPNNP